jgi:hypothetical protein
VAIQFETLTRELGSGIYAQLGGELSLAWDDSHIFGAYASSRGTVDEPPQHCITIHYAFVIQVWRDAENFCQFLNSIPAGSDVDKLYDVYGDRTKLPKCFTEEEQIKNLFIAALTWVYFHELGHLMQEHGYIRSLFGVDDSQQSNDIHEFNSSEKETLFGRNAVVSHVTELAADFEATYFHLSELIRHIMDPDFVSAESRGEVFGGLVYLMICALSIVFYRFNGLAPPVFSAIPQGSHPDPLVRLEINLPHIFEMLDLPAYRQHIGHILDRKDLVLLSGKAALSVALYWTMKKTSEKRVDDRYMIKGLLSRPEVLHYLQPIVKAWDEILPAVKQVRRFGHPFGLLVFTEQFRDRINKVIPWGDGPEVNSN